ncbi:hypothetical protein LJY25_00670 [Hymenobacter sp. BT175]|nr:hypothetical protein [Hymenobacter translucens]
MLLACVGLTSCSADFDVEPGSLVADIGAEFPLYYRQMAVLQVPTATSTLPNQLRITAVDLRDYRCPDNAKCLTYVPSEATLRVEVSPSYDQFLNVKIDPADSLVVNTGGTSRLVIYAKELRPGTGPVSSRTPVRNLSVVLRVLHRL